MIKSWQWMLPIIKNYFFGGFIMQINANIAALYASHNINLTNAKINKSLERLSSGSKINSVSDDPTGMAMSNKMRSQILGLKNASRNSADAVSLVQTAEGAMNEVHEMLKRIRELSVQAANGTNTPDDRDKMNLEVQQLISEIGNIPETTEFNTMKLLNGTLDKIVSSPNKNVDVIYSSASLPEGKYSFTVDTPAVHAEAKRQFTVGTDGTIDINGEIISISSTDSRAQIQEKLTEASERLNLKIDFDTSDPTKFTLTSLQAGSKHPINISSAILTPGTDTPGTDAKIKIDPPSSFTNAATAQVDGNRVTFTDAENREIVVDLNNAITGNTVIDLNVSRHGALVIHTGPNEDMRTELVIPELSAESLGLRMKNPFATPQESFSLINISSVKGAQDALGICDQAISRVSDMRATLGAYQNRMEYKIKSLDNTTTNSQEALSRLNDTDMAQEMSEYTLKNVILKSAISILAQANEQPGQLLQLLR